MGKDEGGVSAIIAEIPSTPGYNGTLLSTYNHHVVSYMPFIGSHSRLHPQNLVFETY